MKVSIEIENALGTAIISNVRSAIDTKFSDKEIVQMFFEYYHECDLEVGVEVDLEYFIDSISIKKWKVYEAQYDIEVVGIIYFAAPYVGVYKRVFPSGEPFVLVDISNEDSQVGCVPLHINKFEDIFIPRAEILSSESYSKEYGDILLNKKYKGYFFIIPFDTLNRCCKNVSNSEVIDPLPFPELGFFLHLPKFLKQGMPEGLIKHTI